jgi:uncharacterized DUF497 family protein
MQYEYDPVKSAANKEKHGINFEEAQTLWDDEYRIEADTRSGSEARYAVIGQVSGLMWTAICTDRGQHIRIISVRRARKEEAVLYEREKNNHR